MTDPGTLLEAIEVAPDVPGSRAFTVRFASSDMFGRPTQSTGVVAVPAGEGRDRPVVVWCHGTTGLGDAGTPSRQPNAAGELITFPEASAMTDVDRGVPGMAQYLSSGAVVVAPDYQGMGTDGFHHYCCATTGARDAVNAVRSLAQLEPAGAGTRFGALGWSEGGGMALGVPELPGDELRGLDLRAVSTFAPGVPGLVAGPERDTVVAGGRMGDPHVVMLFAVVGWLFDDLEPTDVLAPETVELVGRLWNDVPGYVLGQHLQALAADQDVLNETHPQHVDRWLERLASVCAGQRAASAPVFVATGLDDDTVFPRWQEIYLDAARALGTDATQTEYAGEDHCTVPFAASSDAAAFLLDRLGA